MASALEELFEDEAITEVTVIVAWVRFRGLTRLRAEIEAFRDRGGRLRVVVGVDEGGATRPGLFLAMRLADEAFVFHDKTAGTFHPKMFFGEGSDKAVLIVGSSNVTPGGLYVNYEASLRATFKLPDEESGPVEGFRAYVAHLLDEPALCLALDAETIDQLVADPTILVSGHERSHRSSRTSRSTAGDGIETGPVGLFGIRSKPVDGAPGLSAADRAELASLEIGVEADEDRTAVARITDTIPAEPDGEAPLVLASWSKVLPQGDAQQNRNPRTNPTGDLRLTQAGHDIDQTSFFRNVLFGALDWAPTEDADLESATVAMDVTIAGASAGRLRFTVTYAPHRESGQRNFTTKLLWGSLLETLKAVDYTGYTVSLSALSNGVYRMDISAP